jgi:ubiquinone/menaquinone biosynthesis C-methylase UbiE
VSFRCLNCQQSRLTILPGSWRCEACGQTYPCVQGIPKLYRDERIGAQDRALRDRLYGGLLGSFYSYVMPLLTLPARPWRLSWRDWIVYTIIFAGLAVVTFQLGTLIFVRGVSAFGGTDAIAIVLALGTALFFWLHPYLFHLLWLAIPVKFALLRAHFLPARSFTQVHTDLIAPLKRTVGKLRVLDVSTGTCASLYKHGWMELHAEFVAVDLSDTMLLQGKAFMERHGVPVRFALADAADLPFQSETFDVVLNYGAINGMSDPGMALREMARVAKKGGLVLFLDEQLYTGASAIEAAYFRRVLSSHNMIHHCPVELLPPDLENVAVHQVYQFYYICTATKR